ncbi:hypothetical protein ACFX13_042459 [Malus domestica]
MAANRLSSLPILIKIVFLLMGYQVIGHEASDSGQYPVVVSTWPFVEAVRVAWRAADNGFSAVDAVVEGCSACEELRCDGTGCWSLLSSAIPELGLTFRRIFVSLTASRFGLLSDKLN